MAIRDARIDHVYGHGTGGVTSLDPVIVDVVSIDRPDRADWYSVRSTGYGDRGWDSQETD